MLSLHASVYRKFNHISLRGVLLHSFRAAVILLLDNHLVKEVNRKHTILLSRAERILAISQILLSASSLSPIARKASLVLRHFLDESGNPTVHSAPPSTRPRDPNASVDWEEAPEKRPKIDEMNPFGSCHHTRKSHSPLPPTIPSTPDEATSGSPMDQSSDNMSSKESSTDNHNRGSPLPVYPWHAILDLELDVEVEESTLNA
ncbi:hypothetical protein SISNIDRAFT_280226 [Sistotremastrum niveocremeum HHB9708]|uniref:Uncharacterized protein n=1 Tax=Sistotremastrum niveocremeum HHB9708 TaxID=1314777 RepID=A0A164NRI0_9AGAM|nr:hypothetical protein SISNIDRAFT_280226 [Sistotremastrum niveocremeum HHB9708]